MAPKLQHPDIIETIRGDLDTLAALAGTVDKATDIGRRLHFLDWVHELSRTLLAELGYRTQAENLDRFHVHFADDPELFAPTPVWDLTRAKVLTMELVKGIEATDISGLQRTGQS